MSEEEKGGDTSLAGAAFTCNAGGRLVSLVSLLLLPL
jgi:hypothetical protein